MGEESIATVDYSKTKAVVTLDLLFKALSAIGLVAIGFVSLAFQDRQSKEASLEVEQQQYLPVFRGISEINLALEEISSEFGRPSHTAEEANHEALIGTRLAYLADGLYFPAPNDPENQVVQIESAWDNACAPECNKDPRPVNLRPEKAVRLLSLILCLQPYFQQEAAQDRLVYVDADKALLKFETQDHKKVDDDLPLDAEAAKDLAKWIPEEMEASDIYAEVDVDTIADDIDRRFAVLIKEMFTDHPKLADKFVTIRNDVLRGRHDLLPSK